MFIALSSVNITLYICKCGTILFWSTVHLQKCTVDMFFIYMFTLNSTYILLYSSICVFCLLLVIVTVNTFFIIPWTPFCFFLVVQSSMLVNRVHYIVLFLPNQSPWENLASLHNLGCVTIINLFRYFTLMALIQILFIDCDITSQIC